jgi:Arc/MetJ-type ribon-helix-helix transcriptional regulator
MTVNLSVKAEAYVQELMRDGRYESAEQVIDSLILKQRADDLHDTKFPPLTPEQIEAELLKGVQSPHRPWEPGEFRELARRLIVEHAGE